MRLSKYFLLDPTLKISECTVGCVHLFSHGLFSNLDVDCLVSFLSKPDFPCSQNLMLFINVCLVSCVNTVERCIWGKLTAIIT